MIKYAVNCEMYRLINRNGEDFLRNMFKKVNNVKIANFRKNSKKEKLYFGKKVMRSLENRFQRNIGTILETSFRYIETVINQECERMPWWQIIGFTKEQKDAAFVDLKDYIDAVQKNYSSLKTSIEEESIELKTDDD